MPRQKNNFLNAKPVSKMGGGSGGVRNPSKPYKKPSASSKPKPSVQTKPVTRSGPVKGPVPPKGSSAVSMPNSRRAGVNLPKVGARAERTATRAAAAKPAAKPTPKPTPKVTASGTAGGAGRLLGAFGTALAIPAAIKNIKDVAERNKRWEAYKERMGMNKPKTGTTSTSSSRRRAGQPSSSVTAKPEQGNAQSRFAGARDANLNRINNDPRFAAPKEKPKPPAPSRRNPPAPAADQRRPGGGNTTPPRSQTPPKPRFTGTADEGRKMWAEKYSSSKYDGQAIQKEAKKLLDEMKRRKEDKSNATKAGWDGNKNY